MHITLVTIEHFEVFFLCVMIDKVVSNNYYSFQENLVELKHHKLVRSIRSGTVSRDLKPNAKTRDQLNVCCCCCC